MTFMMPAPTACTTSIANSRAGKGLEDLDGAHHHRVERAP